MESFTDGLLQFFGNQITWIFILLGGLVTSLKYLDHKQTDKIKREVRDHVNPLIGKICEDLTKLKYDEEKFKEIADLKIKHLEQLMMHFQTLLEQDEEKDYRLRDVEKFG